MAFGATVDALVSRVRRDAQLTLRPTIATLASAYTAGGATLTINEAIEIGPGSVVAVDAELFYVTSRSGSTLNVLGAFEGTTAADHAGAAFVEVDPRIPKASLLDMAEHEIESWGSELFHVEQAEVAVNKNDLTYEWVETNNVLFVLDAWGTPSANTLIDRQARIPVRFLRDVSTVDYPSGKAIQLSALPTVSSIHVVYATPFDLDPFTLATDLVSSCHLTRGQIDVLEAGLRWRLLTSGLVPRTNWQAAGMSRDSEEVTALDVIRSIDMARAVRDRLLAHQALELTSQWPMREP